MPEQASRVEDAELIKVIPVANAGAADICNLVHDKVGVLDGGSEIDG
jgi:cation-transporting ATPase 13A1